MPSRRNCCRHRRWNRWRGWQVACPRFQQHAFSDPWPCRVGDDAVRPIGVDPYPSQGNREVRPPFRRPHPATAAFARRQTVAPKVLDLNDSVAGMLKMLLRLIGEDMISSGCRERVCGRSRSTPPRLTSFWRSLCQRPDAISGVGKVTIETENTAFDEAHCAAHPAFSCGNM